MVTETELAWAAGFFDGEGGTYAEKPGGRILMHVGQSEPGPLERFHSAVGNGRIYGPYTRRGRPNERPVWFWRLCGRRGTEDVLGMLRPYLCHTKIAQAEAALAAGSQRYAPRKGFCARGHDLNAKDACYEFSYGRKCKKCARINKAQRKARHGDTSVSNDEGERQAWDGAVSRL